MLYRKPLAEWDEEELARGRPRDAKGTFAGPKPAWITPEMHEEAISRFQAVVKTGMQAATVDALKAVTDILVNDEVDNRGKPVVGASTKLQAATFLLEHVVGKPKQTIEQDISVKLQGLLASVMVQPDELGGMQSGHLPGYTMELAEAVDPDEYEGGE